MTSMRVRGDIETDGTLRLAVPIGLPAGPADVLVVVQPDAVGPDPDRPRPSARSGLFVGDPAILNADVDAILQEMNDAWKTKLSDLP